jgi:hypothetical protein
MADDRDTHTVSDAEYDFCETTNDSSSALLPDGGVLLPSLDSDWSQISSNYANETLLDTNTTHSSPSNDAQTDPVSTSASTSSPRTTLETQHSESVPEYLLSPDLNPCFECGSYHYTHTCIYAGSFTDYLAYYTQYLSSLPHNLDVSQEDVDEEKHEAYSRRKQLWCNVPIKPGNTAPEPKKADRIEELSDMELWQLAADLDDEAEAGSDDNSPGAKTTLKQTAMTKSIRSSVDEELVWSNRLAPGSAYGDRKTEILRAWQLESQRGRQRSFSGGEAYSLLSIEEREWKARSEHQVWQTNHSAAAARALRAEHEEVEEDLISSSDLDDHKPRSTGSDDLRRAFQQMRVG